MSQPGTLSPGTVVADRYALVAPAPDRGRGEAWRAKDTAFRDRAVLLKVLPPGASGAGLAALAALRHPNVLAVLDHGTWAGRPWLALDRFAGASLGTGVDKARAVGRPLDLALVRAVADAVCAGLAAAHAAAPPLAHGALDPGAVLVQRLPGQGVDVRLVDAGLAALAPAPARDPAATAALACAAPEVVAGAAPTARSDVYAAGVLLRALFAELPPPGDAVPPRGGWRRRADVPEAVWSALDAATSARPEDRPADAAALRDALALAWARGDATDPAAPPAADEPTTTAMRAAPDAPDTLAMANFPPDLNPWDVHAEPDDPLDHAETTVQPAARVSSPPDTVAMASFPPGANPWPSPLAVEDRAPAGPAPVTRAPYAPPEEPPQEMVPRSSAERALMVVAGGLAVAVVVLLVLLLR